MAYLGVMEAVRARLEGRHPLHAAQLPDLPETWDHESPDRAEGINLQASVDAFLRKDAYTSIANLRVPIFFFDYEGQRYETAYPSLTFEILDVTPRYNEFIFQSEEYQGDVYEIPVSGTTQDIWDDGQNLTVVANDPTGASQAADPSIVGISPAPRAVLTRLVEHPLDILFEVRAYAKDPIISALLVEYVYRVFPPRHFIRVPMKDGSHRDWDMAFESYRDLDKREAVRSGTPGVEREYAKVWTYRVEGYFDNTDTAKFANLVRRRTLNGHDISEAPVLPDPTKPPTRPLG